MTYNMASFPNGYDMSLRLWIILPIVAILCCCQNTKESKQPQTQEGPKEISFFTPDSIQIFGDLYELDKNSPTILLFHQGGSNARAEYGSIVPRLLEKGFNILATDQRMGGQYYGSYNRTLEHISDHLYSNAYGFCDAYNNLESALDYVVKAGFKSKIILWGSSYSATLAIQLAHKNQDAVSGVLAFSPAGGAPMKDCPADPYFDDLQVPLLVLRPPNEMEIESVQKQFDLVREKGHQVYAAINGVHGSSMLVEERVGADVSDTWDVVFEFLQKVTSQ